MKVPNKIKGFAWRACKDGLPTTTNLVKKHVLTDDTCRFCLAAREDITYVVVNCGAIPDMWQFYLPELKFDPSVSLFEKALQICEINMYEILIVLFALAWSF